MLESFKLKQACLLSESVTLQRVEKSRTVQQGGYEPMEIHYSDYSEYRGRVWRD